MSEIYPVDLWYKIPPGQSLDYDAIVEDLRRNGVIVLDRHPKGVKKRDLRFGLDKRNGYLNVSGYAVEMGEGGVGYGSTDMGKRILKDLRHGLKKSARPTEQKGLDVFSQIEEYRMKGKRFIPIKAVSPKSGKSYVKRYYDVKQDTVVSVRQQRKLRKSEGSRL